MTELLTQKPSRNLRHGAVTNEKQGVLVEVPKLSHKDNPRWLELEARVKTHRGMLAKEGDFFDYTLKHPELCPPVGTILYMTNKYGVKAKLTVVMVLRGLPGTEAELLPLAEQPKHLQNSDILTKHIEELGQPGFTHWADIRTWELWQRRNEQ